MELTAQRQTLFKQAKEIRESLKKIEQEIDVLKKDIQQFNEGRRDRLRTILHSQNRFWCGYCRTIKTISLSQPSDSLLDRTPIAIGKKENGVHRVNLCSHCKEELRQNKSRYVYTIQRDEDGTFGCYDEDGYWFPIFEELQDVPPHIPLSTMDRFELGAALVLHSPIITTLTIEDEEHWTY